MINVNGHTLEAWWTTELVWSVDFRDYFTAEEAAAACGLTRGNSMLCPGHQRGRADNKRETVFTVSLVLFSRPVVRKVFIPPLPRQRSVSEDGF